MKLIRYLATTVCACLLMGCFAMRNSAGGGQTTFTPPRTIDPTSVALPSGYRIEAVATGLTFPTGVAFDDAGIPHVTEAGYAYGEVWTTPRLLRIEYDGRAIAIASGNQNGPWTGVAYSRGYFYVAEGGQREGGRILRISPDGPVIPLVSGLPSLGDHHTNGPVVGPDGWLYFGQGTATNSGVVGPDNADFGWLRRFPRFHDIPCRDITLRGRNFVSTSDEATTGAFSPYGTATSEGQTIPGRLPCGGAVLKVPLEGGEPQLVAWGFRNPFGLAFAPDGRLFVTDNSYDHRGSRPVHGAGDLFWEVRRDTWYGWPDFHGDRPLDEGDHYKPPGQPPPPRLLVSYPNRPPRPTAVLGVHSSSDGFDFSRNPSFGFVGQAFVAQFGDQAPTVGKVLAPVGFKVVRIDVAGGIVEDFAVNKGKINGPASRIGGGGMERPVAARFNPDATALYVVDFGVMLMDQDGPRPLAETGVLWRVVRADARPSARVPADGGASQP